MIPEEFWALVDAFREALADAWDEGWQARGDMHADRDNPYRGRASVPVVLKIMAGEKP